MKKACIVLVLCVVFLTACTGQKTDGKDTATTPPVGTATIEPVETPQILTAPKILLSWESAVTDEGLTDDYDYTFQDGTVRRYKQGEYILWLNEGFNPGKVIELQGDLSLELYIAKNAIPAEYITAEAERSSKEVDGLTYVWWDAIKKGRTLGGSYRQGDADGYPHYGEDRDRINLTDNYVLFVGDERPGEGAELLGELKDKLNKAYSALEKALTEDVQNVDRGQFADWTSENISVHLARLKEYISATSYVTKLGNFVVFNGPYTTLWDVTTNDVYFYSSYHGGGSIWRADFDDSELFLPMYFMD